MKLKIIIVVVVVVLGCYTSCQVSEPFPKQMATYQGQSIYHTWEKAINDCMETYALIGIHLENYIQANDSERVIIEDTYFPYFKIRSSDNKYFWELRHGNTVAYQLDVSLIPSVMTSYGNEKIVNSDINWFQREQNSVPTIYFIQLPSSDWQVDITLENKINTHFLVDSTGSLKEANGKFYVLKDDYTPYYTPASPNNGADVIPSKNSYYNRSLVLLEFETIEPLVADDRNSYKQGIISIRATNQYAASRQVDIRFDEDYIFYTFDDVTEKVRKPF